MLSLAAPGVRAAGPPDADGSALVRGRTAQPARASEHEDDPDEEDLVEGELVEGPIERAVEIVALQIRGRKQVTAKQVTEALEAEGLVEGEQVFWPEDARIDRAVQRLAATGYFDQVAIRLVPVSRDSDRASLVVDLHERGSLVVRDLSAASSLLTPFAGGFDLMERNLAGSRVHLGAAFVVGTKGRGVPDDRRQQAYKIYTELPVIAGTPVGVVGSAYAILANEPYRVAGQNYDPDPSNFDTLRYNRFGSVVGVTIPFRADLRLGIDFRFEAIEAEPAGAPTQTLPGGEERELDLHLQDGLHYLSSAEFSLVWDERNRAAMLGKGGHIRLDVQLSSPAIGSSYEYLRVLIGGGYSFRLPWGHWLTPSLWGGQIAGDAPRFELILPGDLADWTPGRTMGLQYSTRWPVDTFKTGVNAYALAHLGGRVDLEYGIPLFRRPRTSFVYGGYLFFSAGLFTLTGTRAERSERRALGEPVAPVGLNADFGLKLDTSIGTFDFSVGNVLRRVPL
ncbi:Outer membrane protein assembly factor BamA [Enhygromyxa salina]|uniref:Outer membrane protein assembly factor BamA n=2 Tax=Enhygromyxa salina TaxID=215803 RepID=A0A2S9YL15_9BACT|nr:Outer membrane protein assembly factor BamA [Enhygromyxa salina]